MDINQHYIDNRQRLCNRVRGRGVHTDYVEDIVQEAYERALRYIESFTKPDEEFDQWFATIVTNCIRDFKNEEKMQGMVISFDEKEESVIPEELDMSKEEFKRELYKRIDKKDEPARNILYLYYKYGFTPSDIYAITESPRGTILSILARFSREVKDYYEERV